MNDKFEKEFTQMMEEKKEIPVHVRQSLDQTYEMIRAKSKNKTVNSIWKRVAAAACALIVTGVVLTNGNVVASLNEFFNFGDKGIEQAVNNGFVQDNNSTVSDNGINITLDKHFSDANKIGISLQIAFDDPTILENVMDVSLDYRLKNGDGEYIGEFIPDTKPLKGKSRYIAGYTEQNPILNVKAGRVQYDAVFDSSEGSIPPLKDAVLEIESVDVFYNTGELKKIDGNWTLAMVNKENSDTITQYAMQDETSIIQVSKAEANPTSLNVTFSLEGIYENGNKPMKIIDEEGHEYEATGFNLMTKGKETMISTNFPITSYNNSEKLKLIVEEIGEVELYKR